MKPAYLRPLDIKHGRIDMNHGAGGRASMQLIDELFARAFDNEFLRQGAFLVTTGAVTTVAAAQLQRVDYARVVRKGSVARSRARWRS